MRFPPIATENWTGEQRTVAAEIVAGPRGELRGPFVPLLYSPGLARAVQQVGAYVRFGSDIPDHLLELAILMTARKLDCAHIWASHSRHGRKVGLGQEIIAAIARRELPTGISAEEGAVAGFCHELLASNKVTEPAFQRVLALWGHKGVMELTGTCGYYGLLAMVLNVAEGTLEPGVVAFASI